VKRSEPPVLRAVKKIEFFANEWYAFKLSKWVKAKKGAAEEGNFTSQRLGADVKGWSVRRTLSGPVSTLIFGRRMSSTSSSWGGVACGIQKILLASS
jgi:hypothetical protein